RGRHYGISHHSLTTIGRVALAPVDVVVPELDGELGARVTEQAHSLGAAERARGLGVRHRLVQVPTTGLARALAGSPVPLSTMGRSLAEDPAPFLSAAAAGVHAARLVLGDQSSQPACSGPGARAVHALDGHHREHVTAREAQQHPVPLPEAHVDDLCPLQVRTPDDVAYP